MQSRELCFELRLGDEVLGISARPWHRSLRIRWTRERHEKNPRRFFVIVTLVIIIVALQPWIGLVSADTSVTQPASYGFISIDIPNSGGELGFTTLTDINSDAEITGGFTNSSGFGFLLRETFSANEIQCPRMQNPEPNAHPQSVNKHREIAGFCSTRGKLHGFFRSRKGEYTLLDFPDANLTEAIALNNDGQIVGDYRDSSGNFHGFFWDAGLFLTLDVPFPGAKLTGPNGINNVGQIVGFYDDSGGGRHGFLYDRGNFISFDFPGALMTAPTDINDAGQIVGVYVTSDGILRSFLFENGNFTTIEVPFPNAVFTEISGLNNRGQIVGRYVKSNPIDPLNPFLSHGFIATPERSPKSESKLVVSNVNNLSNAIKWPQNIKELGHPLAKWRRLLR